MMTTNRRPRILLTNPASPIKITKEGRVVMSLNVSFEAPRMPLSMAIMAAGLEKHAEVRILDAVNEAVDFDTHVQLIKEYRPEVTIVNGSTPTIGDDLAIIKAAKCTGSVTALFGQHADALPVDLLQSCPELDLCFLDEPETAAGEWWNARQQGRDLADIPGLCFRDSQRHIVRTKKHSPVNLESLPRPARHLLRKKLYRLPDGEIYTSILAGRGCPFRCPFCVAPVYHGTRIRHRDPESFVREIESVVQQDHIRSFLFQADLFTANKKWVTDICRQIINRKLHIRWICNSRVDTVDEETLRLMKQAGCFLIGIGIESGSPRMLPILGKHVEIDQIKWMVNTCRKLGIKTNGSFVIGYPGETEETLLETAALVKQLPLDLAVFMGATPFPGTPLHSLVTNPVSGYRLIPDWSKVGFHDYAIEGGLTPERIKQFNRSMMRSYFFSWRYFLLRLGDVKHPGRLLKTLGYAARRLPDLWNAYR